MQSVAFWRRPSFAVREVADLIGVAESVFRGWLARAPLTDFMGNKENGRVYLTGRDIFYWSIVRDLITFGTEVRTAMLAAASHAYEKQDREFLIVSRVGNSTTLSLVDEIPPGAAVTVIPIRANLADLMARAQVVYATEEPSSPARKTGTVNGVPVGDWAAAVTGELDRMERR